MGNWIMYFIRIVLFIPIDVFFFLFLQVKSFLFLNMYLHVAWCLQSIDSENPAETSIRELSSKQSVLFEQLYHFLDTLPKVSSEGRNRSVLSYRVSFI